MSLPAVPSRSCSPPLSYPPRAAQAPYTRPYARSDLRVGDAERAACCEALSIHFAQGRLTPEELETRLEGATGAVTLTDLRRLTVDLPDLDPRQPGPHGSGPGAVAPVAPSGPTPLDVLIGVSVVGAAGLILIMLFGIGMAGPGLFLASAVGGMLALGVGAGSMHLLYRLLARRR